MTLWRDMRRSWRWIFNARCHFESCDQGRICWRWHLERIDCPTCGHACIEDHGPEFVQITTAIFEDRVPGWHRAVDASQCDCTPTINYFPDAPGFVGNYCVTHSDGCPARYTGIAVGAPLQAKDNP